MINVGFVGAGDIADMHAAAIARIDGARLVAVADLDAERRESLAARYNAAAVSGLEELVTLGGLDVIYILTPPSVHAEQIAAVAEAGLPMMCEKPLALTLPEADQAILSASQARVPLMVGHSHRYHPLGARARDMLLAGELGNPAAIWSHRFTRLTPDPDSWLAKRTISGGLALQYALHDLDWLYWLGGEVVSVAANEMHIQEGIEIEDNLWALLYFENGASGSIGTSWSSAHSHRERGVIGSAGTLRIVGISRLIGEISDKPAIDVDLGNDYDWLDVFVRESQDILYRVKHGHPFAIDGEEGRKALELSLAVQQAALTRRMVGLPLPM